ncbi:hypothetical protein H3Z83_12660 [Tenacibaculum sp. S7007]|uniref:Uncharacterized protein n=1 Tax=Tenacibaculum pelagium TaxID=2759527 RepID=A0A839AUT5_9FLAO|nr:hypothetical protein [Tenacibaculum pelagium]MBA6157361.1 hypothetical protein [Tenacibaculum pelagium]
MKLTILLIIIIIVIIGISRTKKKGEVQELPILEPKTLNVQIDNGINEMLDLIINNLRKENKSFLTNIISNNIVLFQLTHPSMFEITKPSNNEFGITISLNFGGEPKMQEKFQELDFSSSYKYYEYQKIPTYLKNNGTNLKNLEFEIKEILNKVYSLDNQTNIEVEIYDQGPIQYIIPN